MLIEDAGNGDADGNALEAGNAEDTGKGDADTADVAVPNVGAAAAPASGNVGAGNGEATGNADVAGKGEATGKAEDVGNGDDGTAAITPAGVCADAIAAVLVAGPSTAEESKADDTGIGDACTADAKPPASGADAPCAKGGGTVGLADELGKSDVDGNAEEAGNGDAAEVGNGDAATGKGEAAAANGEAAPIVLKPANCTEPGIFMGGGTFAGVRNSASTLSCMGSTGADAVDASGFFTLSDMRMLRRRTFSSFSPSSYRTANVPSP